MTYDEIHTSLKGKSLTWGSASEAMGCTSQHLMNVCSRRADSVRIAKAVSLLIGKEVKEVFDDKPKYLIDKKQLREAKVLEASALLKEAGLAAA